MRRVCYLVVVLLGWGHAAEGPADDVTHLLQRELERVAALEHDVVNVVRPDIVYELYRDRGWQPAWTEEKRRSAREVLRQAHTHGLREREYFIDDLDSFGPIETLTPEDRVRLDVMLTGALLKYGWHRKIGKVSPDELDSNWNVSREIAEDIVQRVERVISSGDFGSAFESTFRSEEIYEALRAALATYRGYAAAGGFDVVPEGPTLREGDSGDRVAAVRRRLAQQGWPTEADDPAVFDAGLAEAVRAFQTTHASNADGVVGPRTIMEMNVPVETRIDQIRASLERIRWIQDENLDDSLIVNIAGFRVNLIVDNEIAFEARAQVGKPYRQTPVFRSDMKYLVLNPTWTVPPTILRRDVIPAIKRDPDYLANKHMDVLTHSGDVVDPASVDWDKYPAAPFPYLIRQRPGPWNALGTIKFIFPNNAPGLRSRHAVASALRA